MITELTDLSKLPLVCQLRAEAWEPDGILPPTVDEHEAHARHWIAFDGQRIIAAARLCVHEQVIELPEFELCPTSFEHYVGPFGSLNRMVVHPEARGRGLAQQLDRLRLSTAIEMGCHTVVVSTPQGRSRRLEALGFMVVATFTHPCRTLPTASSSEILWPSVLFVYHAY